MSRSASLLLVVAVASSLTHNTSADAELPTEFVSVASFIGSAHDRIEEAILAAMQTDHKTVYLPNGTYALRDRIDLNQGAVTEVHLIGESRDGVFLVPDTQHLETNGGSLAHMINLDSNSVFSSVNVSIQNMTIDMRDQEVLGQTETYRTVGHGIRIGQGWQTGQFTVNDVTIRNTHSYGIGIQDRDGHPKNNVTLTNLLIERTGSDGIDTKEAGGDGNRNLVIRNVSVNEVGFLDLGAAPAIDIRYRDAIIENVNLVSRANNNPDTDKQSATGIVFRPFEAGAAGIVGATVSDVYIRGFKSGILLDSNGNTTHANVAISNFRIQGQENSGVGVSGTGHSGHSITDGFVDPAFGGSAVSANGQATVTNVTAGRWDPALTPITNTTFEHNVSLAGKTYSPAWQGIVGSERVGLNPTAGAGPFTFDVTNAGVLQIDYDGAFNAMDRLIVDGTLKLGGELRVNLTDGAPTRPGAFRVFEADHITGSFSTITLPAVPGLAWLADDLTTDGTLALLQSRSIIHGDTNNTSYNASSAEDNPLVGTDFRSDVQAINANWTFKGLDEDGKNDVRGMTFTFDPISPSSLERVWIEARVEGLGGYENDNMALDSGDERRRIADMQGYGGAGGWMTLRYELDPVEYSLLSDGKLNLAFFDDIRVDWVSLSWLEKPCIIPTPGSLLLLALSAISLPHRHPHITSS